MMAETNRPAKKPERVAETEPTGPAAEPVKRLTANTMFGNGAPDLRVPNPPKPKDGPVEFPTGGQPYYSAPPEVQAQVGVPRPSVRGFLTPTKPNA